MSDAVDPHLTEPYGPPHHSCATELVCRDCGYRTPLLDTTFSARTAARASTSTTTTSSPAADRRARPGERPLNIWRFEELLPIVDRAARRRGSGTSPA